MQINSNDIEIDPRIANGNTISCRHLQEVLEVLSGCDGPVPGSLIAKAERLADVPTTTVTYYLHELERLGCAEHISVGRGYPALWVAKNG